MKNEIHSEVRTRVVQAAGGEALAVDGAVALDLHWRTPARHRHGQRRAQRARLHTATRALKIADYCSSWTQL